MEWLSAPQAWVALGTLTALEIVLGIDNIIFISVKGYIYFAMAFSCCVEMLNLKIRKRTQAPIKLRKKRLADQKA